MPSAAPMLVCFAVPEEARPFERLMRGNPAVRIVVSGMGRCNAQAMIDAELKRTQPRLVLTCGYTGALNPELVLGQIVFDADATFPNASQLELLGGRPVRFVHAERIVVKAEDKARLRGESGADAVDMESKFIRDACRGMGIPSATVRVVSDTATQDMPLDFNALLTPDLKMNYVRLGAAILRSPKCVPALMKFGKETRAAADALAKYLARFVSRAMEGSGRGKSRKSHAKRRSREDE